MRKSRFCVCVLATDRRTDGRTNEETDGHHRCVKALIAAASGALTNDSLEVLLKVQKGTKHRAASLRQQSDLLLTLLCPRS